MKAVVLAAGEGARLQPITATRPKHMIQVGGKPILEYCLAALKFSGIKEVIIVTHYKGDTIKQYFGDGKSIGLDITYAEQAKVLGTANAVSVVEPYIDSAFVLVYGDLLFSCETIADVVRLYEDEKPAAVMAVVAVGAPENYGIVELENDKLVQCVVE